MDRNIHQQLASYNKKELKDYCREEAIHGFSGLNKEELISLIKSHYTSCDKPIIADAILPHADDFAAKFSLRKIDLYLWLAGRRKSSTIEHLAQLYLRGEQNSYSFKTFGLLLPSIIACGKIICFIDGDQAMRQFINIKWLMTPMLACKIHIILTVGTSCTINHLLPLRDWYSITIANSRAKDAADILICSQVAMAAILQAKSIIVVSSDNIFCSLCEYYTDFGTDFHLLHPQTADLGAFLLLNMGLKMLDRPESAKSLEDIFEKAKSISPRSMQTLFSEPTSRTLPVPPHIKDIHLWYLFGCDILARKIIGENNVRKLYNSSMNSMLSEHSIGKNVVEAWLNGMTNPAITFLVYCEA